MFPVRRVAQNTANLKVSKSSFFSVFIAWYTESLDEKKPVPVAVNMKNRFLPDMSDVLHLMSDVFT